MWLRSVFHSNKSLIRLKLHILLSSNTAPSRRLSYLHHVSPEPLLHLTVGGQLEKSAQKYGDRVALISRWQNQTLTFRDALRKADKLAAGLKSIGVKSGERVGIWTPNVVEWYLTHMACARGGFVLVNINPAYEPQELQSCVNAVDVKALVCLKRFKSFEYYENLLKISPEIGQSEPGKIRAKEMPSLETVIVSDDDQLKGTFGFQEILEAASDNEVAKIQQQQAEIDPDDICHLQFSSGTTGKPKAIIQSHFQIVNNSHCVGKRSELDRKHHVACMQVPFFHVYGTIIALNSSISHGTTLVLPHPTYSPDENLETISEQKCTLIYGTPTMYVDLINRQNARKLDINPEIAISGGALCTPHLFNEMKRVLKLKKVKSVYGLTETTAVCFQSLFDDDEYHSTSTVGHVSDHLEVKIIDEKGKTVPKGTPGELCVRGYCTTFGYWNNKEATKNLIGPDGWLKTGDQFVLEHDGYGKIVGRLKELIIRGGENIFPSDVEVILNKHPDILECHVVGVPHERLGEEICACVRLKPNCSALTLEDLRSYCKGKMAHFKIPSKLEVVDNFPKTTSGKIQKFKLVQLANRKT